MCNRLHSVLACDRWTDRLRDRQTFCDIIVRVMHTGRVVKRRAWIWMKCWMSTGVRTWTNWLIFEPYPDYSLGTGTRLLSPISYALQCGILSHRENPTYRYWAAAIRGFSNGFIHREPSEQLCRRYMRSTECPSSLLLNSCNRKDAKQCVFLRRLLVALKRADCVVCWLQKSRF